MNSIPNPNSSHSSAPSTATAPAAKPKHAELDYALYSDAKATRTPLIFYLRNNSKITGLVSSFAMFTVRVETSTGPVVVYKHAIDLVTTANGHAVQGQQQRTAGTRPPDGPVRPPMRNQL
jgi:RNA chaperone Hfq